MKNDWQKNSKNTSKIVQVVAFKNFFDTQHFTFPIILVSKDDLNIRLAGRQKEISNTITAGEKYTSLKRLSTPLYQWAYNPGILSL